MNFNSLNRNQEWSSDEKAVYRKLFNLGEAAALGEDEELVNRSIVHTTIAGKLSAEEAQDMRSLFIGIRSAITAQNPDYDLQPHFTADSYTGNKRRIVKGLAQQVVDQIVPA